MNIIIKTKRLLLREFELEDAEEMFLLNADPDVIKYTGDKPFKNLEEARQLISNYDHYFRYGMGRWTMLLKEKDEYIGWAGLRYREELKEFDLGYRIHKKYWGRGYATEAAIACLEYGFHKLKLKRVIARALKENYASIQVMKKIGMHFEKELILHDAPAVVYVIENEKIT